MAEEQFTSRRARREAERVAAEQAFEARETPEQPKEPSSNDRSDLLNPPPARAQAPESRADTGPPSETAPERGASSADQAQESRPPSEAAEPVDPQQAPLPHFESRTARRSYLRDNGLSSEGDLSTGATPVIAGPETSSPEESDEAAAGENESFDTAGFGGSAGEVAARDFESPVTAASAPRPTAFDDAPRDALSQPIEDLDPGAAATSSPSGAAESPVQDYALSSAPRRPTGEPAPPVQSQPESTQPESTQPGQHTGDSPAPAQSPEFGQSAAAGDALNDDAADDGGGTSRSRRMPIVQPPSSSGVRVVTAASAQMPEADSPATTPDTGTDQPSMGRGDTGQAQNAGTSSTNDSSAAGTGTSSDDAARALAANPETRPMETVPEAWALPNPDYEDEETENPPGTRIRASEVTGHDGRILVGEEPSKVPYVVLGVAALFAVALIVIALVMLL
ncbi:hypothetical protein [Brevibacterium sp. UCMA 11754]|uniref:hypothetical protein n=1 Tax=Brevibacterium sp. UCMA 11754 TaxID=2749198 RepID=UPI001F320FFB|nr:hypothetical protein [Brevibacterium sp. UCMA 11754]MCF2574443.1 hypothetical protein [Brevibacterium sp. UCMA 11754]